jgi:hypothetical protein
MTHPTIFLGVLYTTPLVDPHPTLLEGGNDDVVEGGATRVTTAVVY